MGPGKSPCILSPPEVLEKLKGASCFQVVDRPLFVGLFVCSCLYKSDVWETFNYSSIPFNMKCISKYVNMDLHSATSCTKKTKDLLESRSVGFSLEPKLKCPVPRIFYIKMETILIRDPTRGWCEKRPTERTLRL